MIMKQLNVKPTKTKHTMSYNEWTKEFGVSSAYVERPKLFQGNPSFCVEPIGVAKYLNETFLERIIRIFFNKLIK